MERVRGMGDREVGGWGRGVEGVGRWRDKKVCECVI